MYVIKHNHYLWDLGIKDTSLTFFDLVFFKEKPLSVLDLKVSIITDEITKDVLERVKTLIDEEYASYQDGGSKKRLKLSAKEKKESLRILKKFGCIKVKESFEAKMKNVLEELEVEQNTWTIQKTEAVDYENGSTTTPFITKLAEVRGIDLETLVTKILTNATLESERTATLLGEQHNMEDLINNCTNVDDFKSLDIPEECKFQA